MTILVRNLEIQHRRLLDRGSLSKFAAIFALFITIAASGCRTCPPEDLWRLDDHGPVLGIETRSDDVWNLVALSGLDACGHSDAGWLCWSRDSAEYPIALPDDAVAVDGGAIYDPPYDIRYWAVDAAGGLWRSDLIDPIGTDAPWTSVSAGGLNVCGITTGGNAECIFDETRAARTGPFVDIAMGDGVACAASLGNPVVCWDSEGDVPVPTQILSAIHGNTSGQFCGVDASGGIACWRQGNALWVDLETCGEVGPFVDAVVVGPTEFFTTGACGRSSDGTIACFTIDGAHLSDAGLPLEGLSAEGSIVCGIHDGAVTCFGNF